MTLLTVEKLNKQYATVQAVDDLSFQLESGQIFALLGPNGAGKTSTVRMLIGLTQPDRGSIQYFSRSKAQARISAEELGYLPEERGIYQDQKIIDVLVYMGQLRGMSNQHAREAAQSWLTRFELFDRAKEKVSALSKGNQQKVQLIAAILHRPRILVLDEPFSGLDPINQELVLSLLRELRDEGLTILLSAHQMALVERLADQILLMNKGRQVLAGNMDKLRRDSRISLSLTLAYQDQAPSVDELRIDGVVDVIPDHDGSFKLILRDGVDLNSLLSTLGRGAQLKRIHSETVALHDIYLRAVGHREALTQASVPSQGTSHE